MNVNSFGIEVKDVDVWGREKKAKKRQLTNAQKIFAWENKSHICSICGKKVTKFSDAEFDHTRAYSKSGATNLSNVRIVHRACNRLKGNKSLSETKKLLGIKTKTRKTKSKKPSNKKKESTHWLNPFTGKKEKINSLFG